MQGYRSKFCDDKGKSRRYCACVTNLEIGVNSAIEVPLAGEIGNTDAEGATAPETLRHKNRKGNETLERGAHAPADGITLSGIRTEGAPHSRPDGPNQGCLA